MCKSRISCLRLVSRAIILVSVTWRLDDLVRDPDQQLTCVFTGWTQYRQLPL